MSLPFCLHVWIFQLSISCHVWFYLLSGYVFHLSNKIINSYGLEATSSISWHALKNLSWFLECGRWLINASWCTDGFPGKVKPEGHPWSLALSTEQWASERKTHFSVYSGRSLLSETHYWWMGMLDCSAAWLQSLLTSFGNGCSARWWDPDNPSTIKFI